MHFTTNENIRHCLRNAAIDSRELKRAETSFKLSENGHGAKGLLSKETVSKEFIPVKKFWGIEVKPLPFIRIIG
nr:hypothetical protein Iba_chr12aCG11060 [Ipomoea batatas]